MHYSENHCQFKVNAKSGMCIKHLFPHIVRPFSSNSELKDLKCEETSLLQ